MHGTRYISRIREDLTFQVYNLYPDVVYPGRIIRVNIQVVGEPEEDKDITIELELHRESDFDNTQRTDIRIHSTKGTFFDIRLYPVDTYGQRINAGHVLRGSKTLSKHAAHGYWGPDQITLKDAQGNERHESQTDFGWKLYINNPSADNVAPIYIKNSLRLSLLDTVKNGYHRQILTVRWRIFEEIGIEKLYAKLNDGNLNTYSRSNWGEYDPQTGEATVTFNIWDYHASGIYSINSIAMYDIALNVQGVYFTHPGHGLREEDVVIDEAPVTIEVQTTNPDTIPPVLDLNQITIQAEPTTPEAPNGETQVDITFRVKDNISGYRMAELYLRDPNGVSHGFLHNNRNFSTGHFIRDPTVYHPYRQIVILPIGSIPGTWGLAKMTVYDKAYNILRANFTEIIRFEVTDTPLALSSDFDGDGQVAFEDFLAFVHAFGTHSGQENFDPKFDLDSNGEVGFSDFLIFVNSYGKPVNG